MEFSELLKEVHKTHTVEAIAVNCLVPSSKVESWLKGEDLPKKSIKAVLTKILNNLLSKKE